MGGRVSGSAWTDPIADLPPPETGSRHRLARPPWNRNLGNRHLGIQFQPHRL
jgi:hypothetical protein